MEGEIGGNRVAMAAEGEAVKVEGGHVSVTTISMSGPETSNGELKNMFKVKLERISFNLGTC